MTEHNTYSVEHGANASIRYATCSCGWSGRPRRKQELWNKDAVEHVAREQVLAELAVYRQSVQPEHCPYQDAAGEYRRY